MSMFQQNSGLIRLAWTMIATSLIFSWGRPSLAWAQTAASLQESVVVEDHDDKERTADALSDDDAGLRLIRENIYVPSISVRS